MDDESVNTEEEIRQLYEALDERDREISDLKAELNRDHYAEIHALKEENDELSSDNEKHRDDLIKCRDDILHLQEQLKQLQFQNEGLLEEKTQLEDQISSHKSLLETQRTSLAAAEKSREGAKRQKNDDSRNLHRLELENQRLRAIVVELEENNEILVNEIETLVKENSDVREKCDDFSFKCDALCKDFDDRTRENSELIVEINDVKKKLDAEIEAHRQIHEEWERQNAASKAEITNLSVALKQERDKQNEESKVGDKQKLLELIKQNKKLHELHEQCLRDKNQAERDLDGAILALNEVKRDRKEEVASAIRKERVTLAQKTAELELAIKKQGELMTRCSELENDVDDVQKKLEKSEERNSHYEKRHGLNEAVVYQKKLEADIRRRDHDMKQLTRKLGIEIERRITLTKWVRDKSGFDPDFDEEDVKESLACEENGLKNENSELMRQVEQLEADRLKMLARLREKAIEIGEKGVRFLGMDSEQIDQVMEFASNLRQGKIELPLNDRSKELSSQVAALKSESRLDKITIERLERELYFLSQAKIESDDEVNTVKQTLEELRVKNNNLSTNKFSDLSGSILTPQMREKARVVLGEELVDMPAAAQTQLMFIIQEHCKLSQELSETKEKLTQTSSELPQHDDSSIGTSCACPKLVSNQSHNDAKEKREKVSGKATNNEESIFGREEINCFRRAAASMQKRHTELLETVSFLEMTLRDMKNERDELSRQIQRFHGRSSSDTASCNENELREKLMFSESNTIKLTVRCKALEDNLLKEKQARSLLEHEISESKKIYMERISYLEEYRHYAMEYIENQTLRLQGSIDKSIYTVTLLELDAVKKVNALLLAREVHHIDYMAKYREIFASFGPKSVSEDHKNARCPEDLVASGTSTMTLEQRFEALLAENKILSHHNFSSIKMENSMKKELSETIKTYSEVAAKYTGGLTSEEAKELKKTVEDLKYDNMKLKRVAKISASQVASAMELSINQTNTGRDISSSQNVDSGIHPASKELEKYRKEKECQILTIERRYNEKLAHLQKEKDAFLVLFHKMLHQNWMTLPDGIEAVTNFHYSTIQNNCFDRRLISLTKILEETQLHLARKDDALHEARSSLQLKTQHAILMKTELERLHRNCNRTDAAELDRLDEMVNHSIQWKTESLDLKHKLKFSEDQRRALKETVQQLKEEISKIEDHNAKLELRSILGISEGDRDILLSLLSKKESSEDDDLIFETKNMMCALGKTQSIVSLYSSQISEVEERLQFTLRKNKIEREKMQCLKEIIQEKNRVIHVLKYKLESKQKAYNELHLQRGMEKNDRSISTVETLPKPHQCSHEIPPNIQQSLNDARKLIDSKSNEIHIRDQHILDLKQKWAVAEENRQAAVSQVEALTKDAELMKADISTLTKTLQKESDEKITYQQSVVVMKQKSEESDAEINQLKNKLKRLMQKHQEDESKWATSRSVETELRGDLANAKHARTRLEHALKTSKENLSKANEEISKLEIEVKELKASKAQAQSEKAHALKRARLSAAKVKEITERGNNTNGDEALNLQKRIDVLNNTVKGLSTQNSKLRGELASIKVKAEKMDSDNTVMTRRRISSRQNEMAKESKCNECENLETKVKSLEQEIKQGKQRIKSLEHELQSASDIFTSEKKKSLDSDLSATQAKNESNLLKEQMNTLLEENKSLKKEIKSVKSEKTSFDLDLFEEIDNLKSKYKDAVRQLNQLTG